MRFAGECNINGTKSNKLYNQEIISCLKSDFIGLVETHAGSNTDICLDGYYVFRKDKPKKQKKSLEGIGRSSVLVKEPLRKYCKFEPLSYSDDIWVRVQKQVTKLTCDLFLAFVYTPPCNSTYGKANSKDILQKLGKHTEYFSCKGKVIVSGDFNARLGDSCDVLDKEDEPHIPLPHDDTYEFILPRVSCDSSAVNQHGKRMLDLCTDNQMYILNGRTLGDFNGKFTCHTPRESSVVDYFLASRSLSNIVFSMYVHYIIFFSDHLLLTMKLNICNGIFIDEELPQKRSECTLEIYA